MEAQDIQGKDSREAAPGVAAAGALPSSVPWTTVIATTSKAGVTGWAAAVSVPGR